MVAHGGTSVAGSFIQTLTMVDVATEWTECLPLVNRDGNLVVEAIKRAQSLFPWLLGGVDFDRSRTALELNSSASVGSSAPTKPRSTSAFVPGSAWICPKVIDTMVLVKPATVVEWHRKGFRFYPPAWHSLCNFSRLVP